MMANYQVSESGGSYAVSESSGSYAVSAIDAASATNEIFRSGAFNFTSNLWVDDSGNGNNLILKNASARTGNGGDLDYSITGLLTSDTIEVVSGSDTPTIPSNEVLRIGAAQNVYGVTIKRAGEVWAIIPFCEPYFNENIPKRSFDVSGNGHHATASGLLAGNVTTQNNYFYLLEHGYSVGSENILGWDFTTWVGSIGNYDAEFDGYFSPDAQAANIRHIQPTPNGLGCRFSSYQTYNYRLQTGNILTIGNRYRFKTEAENFISSVIGNGLHIPKLGINLSVDLFVVGNGSFDLDGVATDVFVYIMNSNTTSNPFQIDFYEPTLQLSEIVPALLDKSGDAIGNPIEFEQDGSTYLKYTAELQAPAALVSPDQKGHWSAYMNQGLCVNGKTYLIEHTETDHFGSGKGQFEEFVSDGTETLDDNNIVRQLILHDGERGFFFDDDTTPHIRNYDDFVNIKPHFLYCSLPKTEEGHTFDPTGVNGKPTQHAYGWKRYVDGNKIYNITMLKPASFLTDSEKLAFNQTFERIEEVDFGMITFVYDSWDIDDYMNHVAVYESHNFKCTRALYWTNDVTKEQTDALLAAGHEIIAHTPKFYPDTIDGYKNFHDVAANYSEPELKTYYNNMVDWLNSVGYNSNHKILPGGLTDILNQSVVLDYFKSAWGAVGSDYTNNVPIIYWAVMGRAGNGLGDEAALNTAKAIIDEAITNKTWVVFYTHTYSDTEDTITNLELLLDYIAAKTAAGEMIRFCKMEDAYNIIKKVK